MKSIIQLINQIMAYLSIILIHLFRYVSSKRYLRSLLRYVPRTILKIGYDRVAMKSINHSLLGQPKQGSVAFITQSGALEIIVLNMMAKEGLGLSKLISYDNRADIDKMELLDLAQNQETKVIMLYIEAVKQGRQLMNITRKVTEVKPIVVLKAGKSGASARAVLGHTSLLAGSDKVYDAAFKQSGMLRAQTIEEMLDFAKAISLQQPARGRKVAILTNGGGAGIIAADACISRGLELPELPSEVQDSLKRKLLLFSEITNPIDVTTAASAENYVTAFKSLLECGDVDLIILMVYPTPMLDVEKLVDVIPKVWINNPKPLIVSATGSDKFIGYLRKLEEVGIPVYLLPERAVAGAAALIYYGNYLLQKVKDGKGHCLE